MRRSTKSHSDGLRRPGWAIWQAVLSAGTPQGTEAQPHAPCMVPSLGPTHLCRTARRPWAHQRVLLLRLPGTAAAAARAHQTLPPAGRAPVQVGAARRHAAAARFGLPAAQWGLETLSRAAPWTASQTLCPPPPCRRPAPPARPQHPAPTGGAPPCACASCRVGAKAGCCFRMRNGPNGLRLRARRARGFSGSLAPPHLSGLLARWKGGSGTAAARAVPSATI